MSADPEGWAITIERNDSRVVIRKRVPPDELEYGIDEALLDARDAEGRL